MPNSNFFDNGILSVLTWNEVCYYQWLNLGQNTPDTGCCCVCDHINHRPCHISQPGHKFNISKEMYPLPGRQWKLKQSSVKSSNCTSGDRVTRERKSVPETESVFTSHVRRSHTVLYANGSMYDKWCAKKTPEEPDFVNVLVFTGHYKISKSQNRLTFPEPSQSCSYLSV